MLRLKDVRFTVPANETGSERNTILDGISLDIEDGKYIVITGPNGGGKTTLAKAIMGIVKLDSGKIILDGMDITSLGVTERAEAGISYGFQQPPRFKGLTVKDLLSIAAKKKMKRADCCKYLTKVGLCAEEYVDREVDTSLSGGEVKRIEIATVLAKGSNVMIFDEPEAGIDLWSFQNLIRVFENIRESINGTILIISHQERILNIADEIVVIEDGKVKKQGAKEEILPELLGTSAAVNPACSKLM